MSNQTLNLSKIDPSFSNLVKKISGQDVKQCYQCGKCTAGCPIAGSVSPAPHQIIHLIQLGQETSALHAPTIWYCLSCITCTARCPKEVDTAKIMDALREIVCQRQQTGKFPKIKIFEKIFLDSIREHGRLYELGAIMQYNIKSCTPFNDIGLVKPLLQKGKLGFSARGIKDKQALQRIFEQAAKENT